MVNQQNYQVIPKEEDEFHCLNSSHSDYEAEISSRREQLYAGIWDLKRFAACGAGVLCILVLFVTVTVVVLSPWKCTPRDLLNYSPAAEAIRYNKIIYPDALEHKTIFMGDPSPELDAAWMADYDLISRIPKWQADKLNPPSDEIPDDPGYYPVMLDIFHSLHCLNELRMTLRPDYYGEPHVRHNSTAERVKRHLDHCLEHIRMSLWCNADVSPIPFQDLKGPYGLTAVHGYSHTCRDKDAILKWARANKVKGMF